MTEKEKDNEIDILLKSKNVGSVSEYLNDFLFTNFEVTLYHEQWDNAAEAIDGRKYPGFFIIRATKK